MFVIASYSLDSDVLCCYSHDCFDNETVEFLWCYWNVFWLLIQPSWWGDSRARHKWVCASNLIVWALPMAGGMNIEFVNGPTWGRLRERELTLQRCLRTLRAWRPPEPLETMHACRVFVLNNMHILLDFSSVDFQGMLEVLGLLLIFMHRGIWRDFLWWSYYCAFVTVPLCLDDTVTCDGMTYWLYDVLIVCLLFCWLRPMYSSIHTKVNAVPH